MGLAEVPQGGRLVLGFEERRASARLEIEAHPLGLRLLLLEHPRYVLARPAAGLLYLDPARVSLLLNRSISIKSVSVRCLRVSSHSRS
ncbi:MAG: hypothetical protein H0T57_03985 [Rubrobacter sp.]|nr:hypothetical protein [Rubrobacter sp.]